MQELEISELHISEKKLIINGHLDSTLGGFSGLERTDFNTFFLGGCPDLERTDF